MKVLLITDDMLPGGISRHVTDLANGLHQKGISVAVAATDGKFKARLNSNIRFENLFLLKVDSFDKNYFGILPSVLHIRSLLKSEKFDIIHSHKRFTHFLVKKLNKNNIHITSYHSVFENKKAFTTFGDYTICCSESVRQQMVSQYGCNPKKSKTIYNGIDPFKLHNDQQKRKTYDQLGLSPNKKIIASVGQYIPSKDRVTLIKAVNELRKHYDISKIQVVLQGYGKQEKELKNLTNSLKLNEAITFVDCMFDVEALFNISEFMILNPVHSEGFGIVMLEAASIGKMHIGTRVGGIPEFIEDGVIGKLIDPENPEQLAEAISYLLNNPGEYQRMGMNAKKKYDNEFGLDKMVNEIIGVYHSLLSK